MKISQITNDLVKVYLTNDECLDYDIIPGEQMPEPHEMRHFIGAVMARVHQETGFDPFHDGHVVIEAMIGFGGLELNIHRLGKGSHKMSRADFSKLANKISPRTKEARGQKPDKEGGGTPKDNNKNGARKVERRKDDTPADKAPATRQKPVMSGPVRKSVEDTLVNLFAGLGPALLQRAIFRAMSGNPMTFVFESFADVEDALRVLPENELDQCSLYRSNGRYALICQITYNSKTYNLLSEYAQTVHKTHFAADDVVESWESVAEKEQLAEMARFIRES